MRHSYSSAGTGIESSFSPKGGFGVARGPVTNHQIKGAIKAYKCALAGKGLGPNSGPVTPGVKIGLRRHIENLIQVQKEGKLQ